MKSKSLLLFASTLLAACSYQPIAPQLQGKTITEQNAFLVDECEDEAWRGHDSGSHHHNGHKPENKAHVENMKRICNALAKPNADTKTLIKQCKAEAQNKAAFSSEVRVNEHSARLLEICDGFAQVK